MSARRLRPSEAISAAETNSDNSEARITVSSKVMMMALNAQPLFRSRAGKQTPARYFEHRIPLDSIDFDFRRALACSTFEKSRQVVRAAHFVAVNFFQGITRKNWHRFDLWRCDQPGGAE